MIDYGSDRRLYQVMKNAGWTHDPDTGGFVRTQVRRMANHWQHRSLHREWVSWGQAEDALRLADDGEAVAGVAPQSRTVAKIVAKAENAL